MEIGINNHLKKIASSLLLKSNSLTGINVARSLETLTRNLNSHFSNDIHFIKVFGSYERGTILPRPYDQNSDIDVLIGFQTEKQKLLPESYRQRILKFATKFYSSARIARDHPSIVVQLNHINFDLVPCIFDKGYVYDSIEIPNKDGGWMETDPDGFNKKLVEVNRSYNSIVKPMIRLFKAWNSSHDYPYHSFDLETAIVDLNFRSDTYSTGFFYTIQNLPTSSLSVTATKRVDVLRKNADWIQQYLDRQDLSKAKEVLNRIIPTNF